MSSSTVIATRPVRGGAPARLLRAVLTGLSDRAHAAGDARARATGWAVTTVPGPLGLHGRAYRHPAFEPGTAERHREHGPGPERAGQHPWPADGVLPVAVRPVPPVAHRREHPAIGGKTWERAMAQLEAGR
jgi:hypothetical protein